MVILALGVVAGARAPVTATGFSLISMLTWARFSAMLVPSEQSKFVDVPNEVGTQGKNIFGFKIDIDKHFMTT